MAKSVNKAIVIGNVGSEPELRYTRNDTPVLNLSIATNRRWAPKGPDGKRDWDNAQEETTWHKAVVWGRRGEGLADVISVGDCVRIEGRMEHSTWTDSKGIEREAVQVVAGTGDEAVVLLGRAGGGAPPQKKDQKEQSSPSSGGQQQEKADDQLPF